MMVANDGNKLTQSRVTAKGRDILVQIFSTQIGNTKKDPELVPTE